MCLIVALYERNNQTPKKKEYRSAEGSIRQLRRF
jgi:hypothetical protein